MILENVVNGAEQAGYDPRGKRDPFIPLVTSTTREAAGLMGVESPEDITIEGLVYDPRRGSIVVANGTVLKEGEEVGNVKVVRIQPEGAVFVVNGQEAYKTMYDQGDPKKQ